MRKFIGVLHDMIGDHKPLTSCLLCHVIIFEELLPIHLQFDCDDEKAGQVFRSNPHSKNFGSCNVAGENDAANWDELPPLDD